MWNETDRGTDATGDPLSRPLLYHLSYVAASPRRWDSNPRHKVFDVTDRYATDHTAGLGEQATTEIFALCQLSYTLPKKHGGTRTRDLVISIEVTVIYATKPRRSSGTLAFGYPFRESFSEDEVTGRYHHERCQTTGVPLRERASSVALSGSRLQRRSRQLAPRRGPLTYVNGARRSSPKPLARSRRRCYIATADVAQWESAALPALRSRVQPPSSA